MRPPNRHMPAKSIREILDPLTAVLPSEQVRAVSTELEATLAQAVATAQIDTLAAIEAQLGLAAKNLETSGKNDPLVMRGFRAAHERITHLHGTCRAYFQFGHLSNIDQDIRGRR